MYLELGQLIAILVGVSLLSVIYGVMLSPSLRGMRRRRRWWRRKR